MANFTETIQIGTYVEKNLQAPQSGILLGYVNYPVGTIIETTCIVAFDIPTDATFYMQHGGSDGASVLSWEGPDNFTSSGSAEVKFKISRTGEGSAVPIYLFAVNDDGYQPYKLQITCHSTEVTG